MREARVGKFQLLRRSKLQMNADPIRRNQAREIHDSIHFTQWQTRRYVG
jgi:hypothetical protein